MRISNTLIKADDLISYTIKCSKSGKLVHDYLKMFKKIIEWLMGKKGPNNLKVKQTYLYSPHLRKKRFGLNKMFQQNASKFAIFFAPLLFPLCQLRPEHL